MNSTYGRGHLGADVLVVFVATFVLHIALALKSGVVGQGSLVDTDAFMRLIRVEELWLTGNWYQTLTSSLGAPEGLSLHWTRPLDILILLPALLLHVCGLEMKSAIYWSGVVISPLLQFAAAIATARAARPLWEKHGAWRIAALVLLFNGAAITYCMAARPDHHSLGLLLTVLTAGEAIRAVLAPEGPRHAYRAGAWSGAAIWVSPESLVGIGPMLVTFGLLWLAGGANGRQWARVGRRFSCGMAAVILLAIALEQPPPNWLVPEYDKISILHLSIAVALFADFLLAEHLPWSDWRRWVLGATIALASAAALAWLFPKFYLGPMGSITDEGAKVLLNDVTEMQPLWPHDATGVAVFFGMIGNVLAGLIVIPYCLWSWRKQASFPAALLLSLSYLAALAGGLLHQRLSIPLAAFGAVLGCGLFAMICDLAPEGRRLTLSLIRVAACIIVVFGGQLWLVFAPGNETAAVRNVLEESGPDLSCQPRSVADWLNQVHPGLDTAIDMAAPRQTPIILTESVNYAPELAYRTAYRFVGGPYHRGIDDIADMTTAAMATDDAVAREIVARRQASYVMVCITKVPKAIGESAADSLYHRLVGNEIPAWLTPVPMSPEASREFRLFAVLPGAQG
jgi:hypothetical protein